MQKMRYDIVNKNYFKYSIPTIDQFIWPFNLVFTSLLQSYGTLLFPENTFSMVPSAGIVYMDI